MLKDLSEMGHKILFSHYLDYFEEAHVGVETDLVCKELVLGVFDLQRLLIVLLFDLSITIVVQIAVIELNRYLFDAPGTLRIRIVDSLLHIWLSRLQAISVRELWVQAY